MRYYLGLDSSTQSLSAIVIDADSGEVALDCAVNFSSELPDFACIDGCLPNADPLVKHSDPRMWVAALDLLLARGVAAGFDWGQVAGISGSGQQHGSVYLRRVFAGWRPDTDLATQLQPLLSRPSAPVWMDSSTAQACAEIAAAVGGDDVVTSISGSRAIERFTGPQIRKFSQTDPAAYADTGRIHLVSSFMAAVLCGSDAPIDFGDGAGMNLLDLSSLSWSAALLQATAPELAKKLPATAPATARAGVIDSYFCERYGFRPGTPVCVWSGDNPCSLVGMGASQPGTAVVSLGTSDTFFAAMQHPVTDPQGYGHVFGNPAGGFMSLIAFKNGSLTRDKIRERAGFDWAQFSDAILGGSQPGNDGNLMLPYIESEITPKILAPQLLLLGDDAFTNWQAPAAAARAVVEAQAVSMRLHSEWINEKPKRILVTGGAAQNQGILQVLADVFQATLQRLETGNSAALGAAMRAANAIGGDDWQDLAAVFAAPAPQQTTPVAAAATVYDALTERFSRVLQKTFFT